MPVPFPQRLAHARVDLGGQLRRLEDAPLVFQLAVELERADIASGLAVAYPGLPIALYLPVGLFLAWRSVSSFGFATSGLLYVVGLVLWFFAYIALLRLTWRRWTAVRGSGTMAEHIHGAAALVLIGIGLTMIVDNPFIELARMAPLGVMVGLSLGLPSAKEAKALETAPAPLAVPVATGPALHT